MKCTVFAVLAMLAMAGAFTEARQLQENSKPKVNWGALASKVLPYVNPTVPIVKFQTAVPVVKPTITYQPTTVVIDKHHATPAPKASPKVAPKPTSAPKPTTYTPKPTPAPKPVPVLIPAKFQEGAVILQAMFMKARPAIAKVLKNGGVPVLDSAISNALFGSALAKSAADSKNFIGPAKAVSDAVAQAVWGDATASAAAKAATKFGNNKAISNALANALNGMALSTSTAEGSSIFGMGATISNAQANAICDDAWAYSTSKCCTQFGGCDAVSNAIAMAFKGDASAKNIVSAACGTLSLKGQPCKATGSAHALSIGGDAKADSSSSAENGGLPKEMAEKLYAKLNAKLD